MRMKRGTDHHWEIVKYRCDLALYARCNCGYQYACSRSKRNEDGSCSFEQYIAITHLYCPKCGARKKWYNSEPIKLNQLLP